MVRCVKEYLQDFERISYVNNPQSFLEEQQFQQQEVLDCSLGTNPYGCSPELETTLKAIELGTITGYPDPFGTGLKQAISTAWESVAPVSPDNIFLGTGSMGILERLNKLLLDRGNKVLGYCPQFTEYITEVRACGAEYIYVPLLPETNFTFSPDAFLAAIEPGYTLIYIDNPNNPTGQIINLSVIEEIVRVAEEKEIAVIVDEAYGDFMEPENSAIRLVNKYENLAVVRSFSKGFGLAGLRVGYGVMGKALAEFYKKVDLPFSVTIPGLLLAAEALKHQEFLRNCRQAIRREKAKVIEAGHRFQIAKTALETPILVVGWPNAKVDLYKEFLRRGVMTEPGADFLALGQNYVRLRIPAEAGPLLGRMAQLQADLA